jgi:hypothetical protein
LLVGIDRGERTHERQPHGYNELRKSHLALPQRPARPAGNIRAVYRNRAVR